MDLYNLKKMAGLCLLSFVLVYFHKAFHVFLIALESIPYYLQGVLLHMWGDSSVVQSIVTAIVLISTTLLYSSVVLSSYWLVNRRQLLHPGTLVFGVWFMLAVVMTIGPKALAL